MRGDPPFCELPPADLKAVALERGRRLCVRRAGAVESADGATLHWLEQLEAGATARVGAAIAGFWQGYDGTAPLRGLGLFEALDLELRKAYAAHADRPRECARRIAARLRDGERLILPADVIEPRLLAAALGHPTRLSLGERLRLLACAGTALAGLAASLGAVRLRRESSRPPAAEVVYAVHAPAATRTRPLWQLLARSVGPASAGAAADVLVLGRPLGRGQSLQAAREAARACGVPPESLRLLRPAGMRGEWGTSLAALGAMLRLTAALARDLGWLPPAAVLRGWYFRVLWGLAHRAWVQHGALRPRLAIFGHTGVADTSLLEQALQARGTRTVHLLHGAVNGPYLDGISSLALCQCGADADSLAAWGAYAQARSVPLAQPRCAPPGSAAEWLLLTNLLHPLGASFRRDGSRAELRLLASAAAACALLGLAPAQVLWKPHPSFATLPAPRRAEVLDAVARHGFGVWPQGRPLQDCLGARVVLCTVSTTYLDVLRLGRAPILYSGLPWDRVQFAERVPPELRASDPAALAAAWRRLCDEAAHARAFDAVWQALRPAAAQPGLAQVST